MHVCVPDFINFFLISSSYEDFIESRYTEVHKYTLHSSVDQKEIDMNRPTSTQSGVDPTPGICSSKILPTVKVELKDGDKELIINAASYDPDVYEKL